MAEPKVASRAVLMDEMMAERMDSQTADLTVASSVGCLDILSAGRWAQWTAASWDGCWVARMAGAKAEPKGKRKVANSAGSWADWTDKCLAAMKERHWADKRALSWAVHLGTHWVGPMVERMVALKVCTMAALLVNWMVDLWAKRKVARLAGMKVAGKVTRLVVHWAARKDHLSVGWLVSLTVATKE